jgi:hypothetical protein
MKKFLTALIADPICNAFMSLFIYIFYGAVIGLSLTPSAIFLYYVSIFLPFNSVLNILLFALCVGVAIYMFFICAIVVFGIVERILTIGFKPGRYSTSSGTLSELAIVTVLVPFAG